MMAVDFLFRWAHVLFGITWIGLLYYFNFIQGEYFKEAEQAVNDSLLREIEDAVTFFDILAESGQDQFYYSYNSWNNSRSGMNESAVSPQASKIIRHLIYPTDPVTSESFNQELSLSDPFHLQMFKVAIIQSLYPETKIDKNTLEKINSDFDANLESNRRNPITKAARSINNGTNPIVAANEAGLTGTIGVDGLVALAAYYKAIKEKKETIKVNDKPPHAPVSTHSSPKEPPEIK